MVFAGIFPGGGGRDLCRQPPVNNFLVLFQTRHKKYLVINFSLLKLVSTQRCTHSPLTPLLPAVSQPPPLLLWRSTRPSPPSGQPLPFLLAVIFTPARPAVILNPCWRSFSPLPNQRSSCNPPAFYIAYLRISIYLSKLFLKVCILLSFQS